MLKDNPAFKRSRKQLFRMSVFSNACSIIIYFIFITTTQAQINPIKSIGTTRALIVGVSNYQNDRIPPLRFAHRDAEVFAHFLEEETAWKVAKENIVLLTNEEATYSRFISQLEALMKKCKPDDRLILYFSGHGDVEKAADGPTGYLLFHDVAPTNYSLTGAYAVTELDQFLQKVVTEKKTKILLITDACRPEKMIGSTFNGPGVTTAALSELFTNTTKIISCEPDQFSLEDEVWGGGRGLFSYHLVNGLKGMADKNGNRYVNLFELGRYLEDNVMEDSDGEQLPQTKGLRSTNLFRVDPKVLDPTDGATRRLIPMKKMNLLL